MLDDDDDEKKPSMPTPPGFKGGNRPSSFGNGGRDGKGLNGVMRNPFTSFPKGTRFCM